MRLFTAVVAVVAACTMVMFVAMTATFVSELYKSQRPCECVVWADGGVR
jgi:hypothetical protein